MAPAASSTNVGRGGRAVTTLRRMSPATIQMGWPPLIFVSLSLILMFAVPIAVSIRVGRLRASLDTRDRVRVLVNDLEGAATTEALIASQARPGMTLDRRQDSIVAQAALHAESDEGELDSLLRLSDPELIPSADTIRAIEQTWRPRSPGVHADPVALIAVAEHLDDTLSRLQDLARAQSREAQQLNVAFAVILAPFALLSLAVIVWTGRRYVRLVRALDDERIALAKSLEARAALLRGIAHDVKNPLGAAAGFADLLIDGVETEALKGAQLTRVRRIRKLISQALDTIGDLLHVERGSTWVDGSESADPVDVVAIVSDLVEDHRATAHEKSIAIALDTDSSAIVVRTGATHVQHIVGNLLSNAVKYTPPDGLVRVRIGHEHDAGEDNPTVVIEVRDTGPGIPAELREKVFEEFFRAGGPKSNATGHGVGLAISRRLARLLGGDVTVGAAPEGGACFVLRLPAFLGSTTSSADRQRLAARRA